MKNFNRMIFADISLLFVAIVWGMAFVTMKDALNSVSTFWLLILRFGSAALIMTPLFWKRLLKIRLKDLWAGGITGLFVFLGMAFQTAGLQYTTSGKSAFITATYVVIVPFLSWAIKRISPGNRAFLASAICLMGMALLTLNGNLRIGPGDVLTFFSAIFFAAQLVAIEKYASSTDTVVLAHIQIATVALLSLPLALFFESVPTNIPPRAIGAIAFTVIFCTIIAFAIQTTAQKHTTSTHAAILLGLESVFGAISGVLLLGEIFNLRMLLGCGMIFISVLISEIDPAPMIRKLRYHLSEGLR